MSVLKVTSENYEREVLESDLPVVIDFWAPWCGPCRLIAPIIEQFAEDWEGKIKVCKVNVDDEPDLAASYAVMSIPLVVKVDDGRITASFTGYRSRHGLEEELGLNPPPLSDKDIFHR